LLLEISRTFHVASSTGGSISVATQLGYAFGILLFVPLGDVTERRKLILRLFAAVSAALVVAGLAPSFWVLVAASVAIGIAAGVTHIMVPMAPELAAPGESGRAIGTVMTGLLIGVLLGRTASGAVAQMLGWRAVFLLAAAFTAAFVPLLRWRLPLAPPPQPLAYSVAMCSLWNLVREQPVLRQASAVGFLGFAAFISFWTNLTFLLGTPHYHLGTGAAGSFGLLGVAGVTAASQVGKLADRHGPRVALTLALALLCAGYALLWGFGDRLAGLIAGVIVLDTGQQAMQISNQIRIFSLSRAARSRINTVYMIVFFLGGAFGSAVSALAWSRWQWSGVCGFALTMLALAWMCHAFGGVE